MNVSVNSGGRRIGLKLFCTAFTLSLAACSKPAPLAVNFRTSLLDSNGLVMLVRNTGDRYLSCRLYARNKVNNQSMGYSFDVGPGSTKSIGVLETGGWSFKTGESVEIHTEGFSKYSFKVP